MAAILKARVYSRLFAGLVAVAALVVAPNLAFGQLPEPGTQSTAPNPLTDTTVKPGKVFLFEL